MAQLHRVSRWPLLRELAHRLANAKLPVGLPSAQVVLPGCRESKLRAIERLIDGQFEGGVRRNACTPTCSTARQARRHYRPFDEVYESKFSIRHTAKGLFGRRCKGKCCFYPQKWEARTLSTFAFLQNRVLHYRISILNPIYIKKKFGY